VAVAAAIIAATAPGAPTGLLFVDRLLSAGLALTVTLAASRARRWTWLWLAGIATAAAVGSTWVVPGACALALSSVAVVSRRREPLLGAGIAALSVQSLLHIQPMGFFGLPSLLAATAVVPVAFTGWRGANPILRRRTSIAMMAVAGFAIASTAAVGVSALLARSHVYAAIAETKSGLESLRSGDQVEAGVRFDLAASDFKQADGLLSAPWSQPARLVPVVAQQADALRTVTASGKSLTETAGSAARTAPYQQLRAKSGEIDLAAMAAMQKPVAQSTRALQSAQTAVDRVQSPWLLAPLAQPVSQFADQINRTLPQAIIADDTLRVAPGLLGAKGIRRYMIEFATPAEMRFQGGFIGAYGILTADNGKISLEQSGSIGEISEAPGAAQRVLSGPRTYVERYGRMHPARYPQNLTASPDFPDNAAAMRQIYPQAGGQPIDGVIYVDPAGLAGLLQLTGPVQVAGLAQPLDASNAAQYLLADQYLAGTPNSVRDDRLVAASKATFEALVNRDLPSPKEIGSTLGPLVAQGRLLFTTFDPTEERYLDGLGTIGRFLPSEITSPAKTGVSTEDDWLSVRTSNTGANKIDVFLHRDVTYDVHIDPVTGDRRATATIVLRNDAPASGLPRYVIGNSDGRPDGTNELYLGVFTGSSLVTARLDGRALPVESQEEFGGNVYSARFDIPPGATRTVVLDLEGGQPGSEYRLTLPHQPTANDDDLHIRVDTGSGSPTVIDLIQRTQQSITATIDP
jgi:hypothetical protein